MAEAVGEDQLAARVGQLSRRFVALVGLRDVGLKHHLVVSQAKLLLNRLGSVHEVLVVGGVFVVQENEADLEFVVIRLLAGRQSEDCRCRHRDDKHKRKYLFEHIHVPPKIIFTRGVPRR